MSTLSHGEFSDLTRYQPNGETVRKLSEKFCREHQVVLLGAGKEDPMPLGMLDVSDDQASFAVQTRINQKIRRIQLNACELDAVLGYGFGLSTAAQGDGGEGMPAVRKRLLALSHDQAIVFDRDQSAVRIVQNALSEAVRRRASDVHIEIYDNDADLRFRIDGVLHQIPTPISLANAKRVVSHLKILADMDVAESRRDQDGRIGAVYEDEDGSTRRIDMRLSVLPGPHGSDAVIRILDGQRINMSLEELGLNDTTYDEFSSMIRQPGGLIVVTGPTASGKTTTLYAAINEINSDTNKILTVEDPIEYAIPRVNQKQVSSWMSFADYSRAFMRQNPDVLMIGEVRDEETAEIALRAAQMGHLVLTTLHAKDVQAALKRLRVLCDDRFLLRAGVLGVLSQRLVRKVCLECATPYEPSESLLAALPPLPGSAVCVHGTGCDACDGVGYHGQTGVFELLTVSRDRAANPWHGVEVDVRAAAGFRPMCEHAVQKIVEGITTVEEVLRNVPISTGPS